MKGSRSGRRQSLVLSPSMRNGNALIDTSVDDNKTPTKKISPLKSSNKLSPTSSSSEKKDNGRQSISPLTPSKVTSYDNKVLKAYMNNQLELNESEMKYYEDVVDSLAEELNNVKQEKGIILHSYLLIYIHLLTVL